MEEPKDFLGNKLFVGEQVVFMQLGYRRLMKGIIKSISPKMVTISHEATNTYSRTNRQFFNQVIKINVEQKEIK